MTFTSFDFVGFYIVVLLAYYCLQRRGQNVLLLVASYTFYGAWDYRFLLLLGGSTLFDYLCAQAIEDSDSPRRRRILISASICTSLCVLGYFKYANFFIESFLALTGNQISRAGLDIILPVGISFYTFQSMSYTIDVYRRQLKASRRLGDFALYVAYFPQLVAGPIERAGHLLTQLEKPRRVNNAQIASGLQLILFGFFKKLVIADGIAPSVHQGFSIPWTLSSTDLIATVYLFAFQIYADFSGYSDIARGTSRLLGIELMINFKQPYLSSSITEFWRRWHISLSTWLRDYVYVSLGGNRHGRMQTRLNLLATMLLGGLWHGASSRFLVWGGLHGLFLVIHKWMIGDRKVGLSQLPNKPLERVIFACKVVGTFHLVCFTWIFFRARSVENAMEVIDGIFSNRHMESGDAMLRVVTMGPLLLLVDVLTWHGNRELPVRESWPAAVRGVVYASMFLLISFVGESVAPKFIYFQF